MTYEPKMMEMYASMLRAGDLMMGHDYPGEVADEFLDRFGVGHPDLEEVGNRAQYGATLWRKAR